MRATPREVLGRLFEAAVAGAIPERATRDAVAALALPAGAVHIIGLGKAAQGMAAGAVAALAAVGREPAGGVIVTPAADPPSPHRAIRLVVGDHPVPGAGSLAAADAIADAIARVGPQDTVVALISGGGSSLAAAPLAGIPNFGVRSPGTLNRGTSDIGTSDIGTSDIGTSDIGTSDIGTSDIGTSDIGTSSLGTPNIETPNRGTPSRGTSNFAPAEFSGIPNFGPAELSALYVTLLGSGADIATMNAVRKRFTRWSAGRVATALRGRPIHCLVVSDVLGDDLPSISSGPCVPDPLTARDVIAMLRRGNLWDELGDCVRAHLAAVARGEAPETPKPGDPAFDRVTTQVIVSNRHAVEAAAACARAAGVDEVTIMPTPLEGEASIAGVRLASELIARRRRARGPHVSRCILWGGETTVTLGAAPGMGGRNQELALAAARSLADAGEAASGITLLAAGTDGRDGPTDAAGAIVDGLTWGAARDAGRDPDADLAGHDAYRSLDAAGALLRSGYTGTNVMDVVFGLIP